MIEGGMFSWPSDPSQWPGLCITYIPDYISRYLTFEHVLQYFDATVSQKKTKSRKTPDVEVSLTFVLCVLLTSPV